MIGKKATKGLSPLLAFCLLFSLAACTGSNSQTGGSASVAGESEGLFNTLVYAGKSESTINSVLNNHDELPDLIFSGLIKYDGSGIPVCDLAERYNYDDVTLTYTLRLRSGVKRHGGKEFMADDVVYTYDLSTKDKSLSSTITSNYENIVSAAAPDKSTVIIRLGEYNAVTLDYFAIGILPKHLTEGQNINTMAFNRAPVDIGRYRFVKWDTAGGRITLERNSAYYGKVPNIERVIYKTVAVESTKATMLQSGEADLAWLNAKYADTFHGKDGYQNVDFKTADYRGIPMDFGTKFWQENGGSIGALDYVTDKEAVVKSVLARRGLAAYSPVQLNRLSGSTAAGIYPYNPNQFAQQTTKLGWAEGSDGIYERRGEKFHFIIQVRDYKEERVDIANLCASQLKAAGVDMEAVLVTKFDWKASYSGFLSGYAVQFDPDMFYENYVTGASDNIMKCSNVRVDQLLSEGRHTKDESRRKQIYQEFEGIYAQQPGTVLVAFLDGCYVNIKGLDGLGTMRLLRYHVIGVLWNIEGWTLSK